MKKPLLVLALLTTLVPLLSATVITRALNLDFTHTNIQVDFDNDGDFDIAIQHQTDIPLVTSGPPCDYVQLYSKVIIKSNLGINGNFGSTTNNVTLVSSATAMSPIQIVYINQGEEADLRLGSYLYTTQSSGTCYPYSPYLDTFTGFLTDTAHTTNTYFAFYANLNGVMCYGFLVFNGYQLKDIVYDDAADTPVSGVSYMNATVVLSSTENGIKIESNQDGMISISAESPVQKVVLSDLSGRTEEYHSSSFHTTKKGWVVLQVSTASGILDRRRVFIQ